MQFFQISLEVWLIGAVYLFYFTVFILFFASILKIFLAREKKRYKNFLFRYTLYGLSFAIYDFALILISLSWLYSPIFIPITIYLSENNIIDFLLIKEIEELLANEIFMRAIFVAWIHFLFFGIIFTGVFITKLENPADYNKKDKNSIFAKALDRFLNSILKLRKEIDLSKYKADYLKVFPLKIPNNIKDKMIYFEKFRWQKYQEMMQWPMRKRLMVEIIILSILVASGIYGVMGYIFEVNNFNNELDGFFILSYGWGSTFWFAIFYTKRRYLKLAKHSNVGKEKLTKRYLPQVINKYKSEVISQFFNQQGIKYTSSRLHFYKHDLINNSFFNFQPEETKKLTISDFLETTINKINLKFYDFNFHIMPNGEGQVKPNFSGLYLETDFQESFKGETWLLTQNKLYAAKSRINYPDTDQTVKFETESLDFNNQFIVYTTDQVEARLALKTNIMLNLLKLASI